ncbi:MAG TPA: hypothetical protein VF414_13060 [Thermoanaerobaculia bacterium]
MPLEVRTEIEVFAAPPEVLESELPADDAPVLETPVLVPVDLTETHGTDITLARLEELAASYDPQIEMAPLNIDHAYGGPSFGWCEAVWVQEGALWVRYIDLAAEAVEGIRKRRYTRRSAEIMLKHPVTGGWYFVGLALLGTQRPAVLGLPPLQLHRPRYFRVTGAAPRKETHMSKPLAPAEPPQEQPAVPEQLSATELQQLRAGVAIANDLRRQNAELKAEKAIERLGARATPAMRKILQPLLAQLMAQEAPTTIKLSQPEGANTVEKEVAVADAVLQVLAALPPFEALGLGALATDDGASQDTRSADEVALHSRHKITPERAAELRLKYQEGN